MRLRDERSVRYVLPRDGSLRAHAVLVANGAQEPHDAVGAANPTMAVLFFNTFGTWPTVLSNVIPLSTVSGGAR